MLRSTLRLRILRLDIVWILLRHASPLWGAARLQPSFSTTFAGSFHPMSRKRAWHQRLKRLQEPDIMDGEVILGQRIWFRILKPQIENVEPIYSSQNLPHLKLTYRARWRCWQVQWPQCHHCTVRRFFLSFVDSFSSGIEAVFPKKQRKFQETQENRSCSIPELLWLPVSLDFPAYFRAELCLRRRGDLNLRWIHLQLIPRKLGSFGQWNSRHIREPNCPPVN